MNEKYLKLYTTKIQQKWVSEPHLCSYFLFVVADCRRWCCFCCCSTKHIRMKKIVYCGHKPAAVSNQLNIRFISTYQQCICTAHLVEMYKTYTHARTYNASDVSLDVWDIWHLFWCDLCIWFCSICCLLFASVEKIFVFVERTIQMTIGKKVMENNNQCQKRMWAPSRRTQTK